MVKNPPVSAGYTRASGLILGLGRSPGAGNGNLLQYSCLGHPMDRGSWRATVHGVAKSQTQLKELSTHGHTWSPGDSSCAWLTFWSPQHGILPIVGTASVSLNVCRLIRMRLSFWAWITIHISGLLPQACFRYSVSGLFPVIPLLFCSLFSPARLVVI